MEKVRRDKERLDIEKKIETSMKAQYPGVDRTYWKNKKDYVEKPTINSCILYNRKKKKYWAKEDALLCEELEAPIEESNKEDKIKPYRVYSSGEIQMKK